MGALNILLLFTTLLLLGSVWSQNEVSDFDDIQNALGEISNDINEDAMPSFDDIEAAIKKKCEQNGGAEAFKKLDPAKDALQECIQSNFDFEVIQKELDAARKTGSMDEVFAKYCVKTPVVQECIKNMTDTFEPCLEESEKSTLKMFLNVTNNLMEFFCYKDGDRIAMFIAEGGFECIQQQSEGLKECANVTMGPIVPTDVDEIPKLVITDQQCEKFQTLQVCVVKELEKCKDTTPANIMEALFKYVRRITPCHTRRYIRSTNPDELNKLTEAYNVVLEKYEPQCIKNGGDKATREFRDAFKEVKICQNMQYLEFTKRYEEAKGLPFKYMCSDFRKGIRTCLDSIVTKIEHCSSYNEKYVPKFGLAIYDSVFDFYCKDDSRALKNFISFQSDTCFTEVQTSMEFCLNKTKHIKVYSSASVVTKTELCSDLNQLKGCFVDVAHKSCPHNNLVQDFVAGLSDAIHAPCHSGSAIFVLTNFLVLVSIFVKFF